jgi:hypothetical protein
VLEPSSRAALTRCFWPSGAHMAKRAFIPAGDSAKVLDAVSVLRSMEGEDKPMLGRRVVVYGGGNTAIDVARTAKRLGATEAIIVYRRTREKMPAHDFEVEEALQEGVLIKWLSTISRPASRRSRSKKWRWTTKAFRSPRASLKRWRPTRWCWRWARTLTLSLIDGVPGLSVQDGVVQVDAQMMTGHAGIFAGGDMVPAERNVTVAIGHGKKAARNIDAWLRGQHLHPRAQSTSWPALTSSTPGTTATHPKPCAPCWTSSAASPPSKKCKAGWTKAMRCSKRGAACPAATALSATTATACARTTR